MTSVAEQIERYDKFTRTLRTAQTYLKKTQAWLYNEPPSMAEYWGLLDAAIETATLIVERLDDEFFTQSDNVDWFGILANVFPDEPLGKSSPSDGPLEGAKLLVAAIETRTRRAGRLEIIRRLEAVEGRTPEEAQLYLAKAAELRAALNSEEGGVDGRTGQHRRCG